MVENKEIIEQAIKDNNPWWKEGYEFESILERKIYNKIKKVLDSRQIIALTGLRRVGKTSLMRKIIEDYLDRGKNSEDIFYFSFDEFFNLRIRDVLGIYEELQDKNLRKDNIVCFLDEIQKVDNWQEQLKRIYDNFPNLKFVISGSESLFIKNQRVESLAGRIYEFNLGLLDFQEYLDFKNINYKKLRLNKEKIIKELNNYFYSGGFPEVVLGNVKEVNLYIKGIIDKVIDSDMPKVFDIKNTSQVRSVFNTIYNDPGEIIEFQDLGDELNLSRNTVSYILNCLENSFLIKKLYNFSRNNRKVERKLKKYYSYLINPYIIKTNFGAVFETFIVINSDAEYFWRDSFKNEVDIVLTRGKEKIKGIEIKSGKIKKDAINSLKTFIKYFGLDLDDVKIISFDTKDKKEDVEIIPFYEYFLNNKDNLEKEKRTGK